MNKITIGISGAVLLAIGLLVGGIVYAQAIDRSGETIVGRLDYTEVHHDQSASLDVCTTSTTYEDVPGMEESFTQGGIFSNEIYAAFTAQIDAPGGNLDFRFLVDGLTQSGSGSGVVLKSSALNSTNNSWNFISDAVSPGAHTATLQWRVIDGVQACIGSRSMIIHHR
ncbi:MAG: hypothetical protein AAB573_01055 [Patescibacteria group bacterium]